MSVFYISRYSISSYAVFYVFICLNVFTVYMFLCAYVMRAIGMLFNKRPLTYVRTYFNLPKSLV